MAVPQSLSFLVPSPYVPKSLHSWSLVPSVPCSLSLCALDFKSPMQAIVENLVKLQSIDLDRARRNKELRALPAEIAQSQARLAAAERLSAESSAALSREETLRTLLER